jgi:hypothetical protein
MKNPCKSRKNYPTNFCFGTLALDRFDDYFQDCADVLLSLRTSAANQPLHMPELPAEALQPFRDLIETAEGHETKLVLWLHLAAIQVQNSKIRSQIQGVGRVAPTGGRNLTELALDVAEVHRKNSDLFYFARGEVANIEVQQVGEVELTNSLFLLRPSVFFSNDKDPIKK